MWFVTFLLACGPDRTLPATAWEDVPDDGRPSAEPTVAPSTTPTTEPPSEPASETTPSTTAASLWCWDEPLFPDVDLSDLKPVNGSNVRDRAFEVLARRWPAGHDLLVEMEHDPYIDVFLESASWGAFADSVLTTVHEETHGWDYEHAIYPSRFGYFLTDQVKPFTPWDDALPRSVIRPLIDDDATWLYADLYLTGQQGTYGFTELLDETNCYVNTLGAAVAVGSELPWGTSARDGAVTFLYYTAVYLRVARTERPSLYAAWQADPDVTGLVRDLWLRTHFFLQYADQDPRLGVEDHRIRPLLYAEQHELEDFLGYPLDASPCLSIAR